VAATQIGLIWDTRSELGLPLKVKRAVTKENHSVAMATYRFFAVDHLDAVMSVRWIDCANDAGARAIGESLRTQTCGMEVWDVGRRVCKMPPHGPTAVHLRRLH